MTITCFTLLRSYPKAFSSYKINNNLKNPLIIFRNSRLLQNALIPKIISRNPMIKFPTVNSMKFHKIKRDCSWQKLITLAALLFWVSPTWSSLLPQKNFINPWPMRIFWNKFKLFKILSTITNKFFSNTKLAHSTLTSVTKRYRDSK